MRARFQQHGDTVLPQLLIFDRSAKFSLASQEYLPCQGCNNQIEGNAFPGLGAAENGLNDLGRFERQSETHSDKYSQVPFLSEELISTVVSKQKLITRARI